MVKGAIFRDAGKRITVSIFRAEDLSFVLCSNLCRIKEIMVSLVQYKHYSHHEKDSETEKFNFTLN